MESGFCNCAQEVVLERLGGSLNKDEEHAAGDPGGLQQESDYT